MFDGYLKALKRYAVFRSRARRREYWSFVVVDWGILLSLVALERGVLGLDSVVMSSVYRLSTACPALAVLVRRFHDTGRSWPFLLIMLIPLAGPIYALVVLLGDSQVGDNRYGPDPKLVAHPPGMLMRAG